MSRPQTVKPGLAESWTNSPDGKTWTFKLRKNLRWSDGAPLTADDVVFTWNDVIYNPKIDNVTRDPFIINGKKFTMYQSGRSDNPGRDAGNLRAISGGISAAACRSCPNTYWRNPFADGTFTSAYGINWKPEEIVGSGPFRLKEYKPAQYTLLERNPYFLRSG